MLALVHMASEIGASFSIVASLLLVGPRAGEGIPMAGYGSGLWLDMGRAYGWIWVGKEYFSPGTYTGKVETVATNFSFFCFRTLTIMA
jgi:hypothetical protein